MSSRQRWSCQVDKHTAEKYKQYFRKNDIYFEPSEFYDLVNISFDVSEEELKALDNWIKKNYLNRRINDYEKAQHFRFDFRLYSGIRNRRFMADLDSH